MVHVRPKPLVRHGELLQVLVGLCEGLKIEFLLFEVEDCMIDIVLQGLGVADLALHPGNLLLGLQLSTFCSWIFCVADIIQDILEAVIV